MSSPFGLFGYPFRDPGWAWKMIPQALILLIPIVGWIATTGWLMLVYENARSGREELPPAGFHLARGFGIWVVVLVYWVVIYGIPIGLLYAFGRDVVVGQLVCNRSTCYQAPSPFAANFYPWSFFAILAVNFLAPSLIVNTYEGGIAGGLDIRRVWRLATTNPVYWFGAGVVSCGAAILGAWGGFAGCIGILFTLVYQDAIQASLAAWLQKGPPTPVMQPRL